MHQGQALAGGPQAILATLQPALKSDVRSRMSRKWIPILLMAGLAGFARLALADPIPDRPHSCEAAQPQEAKALADSLYEKGEYQHAGECYDAAGDLMRAQRAYLKAVGPNSESAARGLKADSSAAKALFTQVQQAFRTSH